MIEEEKETGIRVEERSAMISQHMHILRKQHPKKADLNAK